MANISRLLLCLFCIMACSSEDMFDPQVVRMQIAPRQPGEIEFVHLTDIHGSNISLEPAAYYLENSDAAFGLLTGDVLASEHICKKLLNLTKPFLLIPGNHDIYTVYNGAVGQKGFRTKVLDSIGQERYVSYGDRNSSYWYTDFYSDGHTLRVIGIDQYEIETVGHPNGTWNVHNLYSQKQVDWLVDVLDHSYEVDGIIFAIHNGFGNKNVGARDTTAAVNSFTSILACHYDDGYNYLGNGNVTLIPDIVNAYQTGENLNDKRYPNSVIVKDTLTVTTNFQGPHDNFIAYFGGHLHWDVAETLPYYPRQLQVLLTYGGRNNSGKYDDLVRAFSDENFYAFNTCSVNFMRRELKLKRIGANLKTDGTLRDSIVFKY